MTPRIIVKLEVPILQDSATRGGKCTLLTYIDAIGEAVKLYHAANQCVLTPQQITGLQNHHVPSIVGIRQSLRDRRGDALQRLSLAGRATEHRQLGGLLHLSRSEQQREAFLLSVRPALDYPNTADANPPLISRLTGWKGPPNTTKCHLPQSN